MNDIKMEISIPADIDGFILLQCPLCSEFFKLRADEIHSDDVIEIWCPYCGLKGYNYLTDDVIELALKMASNKVLEIIHKKYKKHEQKTKNCMISLKAGQKTREEIETPIMQGINVLDIENYGCCNKQTKIKPIIKMVGSYCPYCGVRYDKN